MSNNGKDTITNRGFIHNNYKDVYDNKYRIVESSSVVGSVWIFGDTIMNGSSAILLYPKDIKKLYKELKRISKGKRK